MDSSGSVDEMPARSRRRRTPRRVLSVVLAAAAAVGVALFTVGCQPSEPQAVTAAQPSGQGEAEAVPEATDEARPQTDTAETGADAERQAQPAADATGQTEPPPEPDASANEAEPEPAVQNQTETTPNTETTIEPETDPEPDTAEAQSEPEKAESTPPDPTPEAETTVESEDDPQPDTSTTQTEPEEVEELSCEIFMVTADPKQIRCATPTASAQCQPIDGWIDQYWFSFSDASRVAFCGAVLCPDELIYIGTLHDALPSPGGQFCAHRVLAECSQEALFFLGGRLACWEGDMGQIPSYRGVIFPCPVGYVFVWWYASDIITYTDSRSIDVDGIEGSCDTVDQLRAWGVEIVD